MTTTPLRLLSTDDAAELGTITVYTGRCELCRQHGEISFNTDVFKTLPEGSKVGITQALLHHASPPLTPEAAEQLVSGLHPQCYRLAFDRNDPEDLDYDSSLDDWYGDNDTA